MEKQLLEWLEALWKDQKRVSRTMIFRKVMELDPKYNGGPKAEGFMEKMKKWFYKGFKVRAGLSVRKIAGAGQKIPDGWEGMMRRITTNVRDLQKVETRPDGSRIIAGVQDRHFVNTDHVPMPIEGVGNFSWGKKNSGRRHVKTAGKEKDRFTCQLSIAKDGTKLIPFLIWKGKFAILFTRFAQLIFSC